MTTINNTPVVQGFVQAILDDTQDTHRVSPWADQLQQIARITEFKRGEMLVQRQEAGS